MRTSGLRILASAVALLAGAAGLTAQQGASGTEMWQGKTVTYELSGDTRPDIQIRKGERDCRIAMTIDGRVRTVTLRDDDLDVDGERFDLGSYARVSLNAGRDFLIVSLVVTRSWGASASGSSTAQTASGTLAATSGKTSGSESSGTSTEYYALGFTDLRGVPIRLRLQGGKSVMCSIVPGADQRAIRFDIDEGKNTRAVLVKPGRVIVDGVEKPAGPAAPILVTASKNALRITAGRSEVFSRD